MEMKLKDQFAATRQQTEQICKPLAIEDYVVQPITDVSPPKWHLGHTTWFFEEFILSEFDADYQRYHPKYAYVFNSYYESVGDKVYRSNRGNLSRPTVQAIYDYRAHVTKAIEILLDKFPNEKELHQIVEIGIHHEKQHQELLLTDIKYIYGHNPLFPVYDEQFEEAKKEENSQEWLSFDEGVYAIGYHGNGFCYDNELKPHKVYLESFSISNKLVTNQEYLEFIKDGGYNNVLLWHAEAWDWINTNKVKAPMYWHKIDGNWQRFTLSGLKPVDVSQPVIQLSYYEASAFAQWKGQKLPTEFEWETAQSKIDWGKVWEWTESSYLPYPGFSKAPGALGEYNGKFMVNQKVLRGKSVATPKGHSRPTYRNFFHPHLRWQFCGFRLARSKK
jgi:ergothioneine biosynthesis protein EgtB